MRTLVLDLDGTLVDSVPDIAASLNRTLAAAGLALYTRQEVAAMVGDGVRMLLQRALAGRDRVLDDSTLATFSADYEANATSHTRLFPGAAPALQRLSAAGWTMVLCTNKPETPARLVLESTGLAPLFSAVGGGDSFPFRKPDPAHLLSTLAAAGASAEGAVMVGDHRNDIVAANAAGIPGVFAAWGYGPRAMAEGAAEIAERFSDLPNLLERIRPPPA
jgi:phosphoglycolate phosphatase